MLKKRLCIYCLLILLITLQFACKEDVTEPQKENSTITGSVLFFDGTVGASATIEIQNLYNNLKEYAQADENGVYLFENLKAEDYLVKFKSTSYNINTFQKKITLKSNDNYNQDIFITYNMLDDLSVIKKNRDVFLIKFQADGAKIGSNYNVVDYLSGTYSRDISNLYSLACDIYKCPDTLNWFAADSFYTPEYIKQNFEFVTSIDETLISGKHEIRFYENDIINILSAPTNGFSFVKKIDDESELKIPCVDFNNNDFGLRINYK